MKNQVSALALPLNRETAANLNPSRQEGKFPITFTSSWSACPATCS